MASESQELELTPDLLEYVKAVVLTEAPKYCSARLARPTAEPSDLDERPWADVVQDVTLQLIRRPPKYDQARGASPKTLIYTIVQRAVMKYAAREAKRGKRYPQMPNSLDVSESIEEGKFERTPAIHQVSQQRHADLTKSRWSMDDILQFIDNEDSRALCKLVIECGGNLSEAARRLGLSEGTVRYRMKLLGPKLLASGFDPFLTGGTT